MERVHIEEDSGKMVHQGDSGDGVIDGGSNSGGGGGGGRIGGSDYSLIDFNRAGIGLIEIVSRPEIGSALEAVEYGRELQRVLQYTGISNCNMQDGSLRCDINISLKKKGEEKLGEKVELKNLNSFSAIQKAVEFEIERQAGLLDGGEVVGQETRTWDEKGMKTVCLRRKEGMADYRYFPEPDLLPVYLQEDTLEEWRREVPELPDEKRKRWIGEYGLSKYDAAVLSDDKSVAMFFDEVVGKWGGDAKMSANWIMGDINRALKDERIPIDKMKLKPEMLAKMVKMIEEGVIGGKIGKDLIPELVKNGGDPEEIVEKRYVCQALFCCPLRRQKEATIIHNFLVDSAFFS